MTRNELIDQIRTKSSFLCVGLDTDVNKIPKHLLDTEDPIFEFNRQIIDATKAYCVSYKLNLAFYEARGVDGLKSLEKTVEYIPNDQFIIADAKRGDIGNTANMYAQAFFDHLNVDAVTLSPYMGEDSITPFLNREGKWAIVLGLTSNKGSSDFQKMEMADYSPLFEGVIEKVASWGNAGDTMFVVGATQSEYFERIRKIIPDHFLLVPGVGAQGGDLDSLCKFAMNKECGLLVNSSRGIIYAGNDEHFAEAASRAAQELQQKMAAYL